MDPARHARVSTFRTLGRVFGSAEVAHLSTTRSAASLGTAGLELHFGGLSAGGGALFGDGLGGADGRRVRHGGDRRRTRSRASPCPSHAVWIRLESTPATRGHVALLRKLWKLAEARTSTP